VPLQVDVVPAKVARLADAEARPPHQRDDGVLARVYHGAHKGGILLVAQPVVRPPPAPRPLDPLYRAPPFASVRVDQQPLRVEVVVESLEGGDPRAGSRRADAEAIKVVFDVGPSGCSRVGIA